MKAGLLDRRATIERYTTVTDPLGGETKTWTPLATVSAQVVQQTGRQYFAADQEQTSQKVVFRMRWIDGITPADRVTYGDRPHDIIDVRELGRHAGLELHTVVATT